MHAIKTVCVITQSSGVRLNNYYYIVICFVFISEGKNALELKSLDIEQPTKPVVYRTIFLIQKMIVYLAKLILRTTLET